MRDRPEVHEIFRRWQEVAGEYIPKPTLMGETYVPLERLPAYYAQLDLVQNFPFLRADLRPRRAATDRRDDDGRAAEGPRTALVRVESRSLADGDSLGGRRRAQAQGSAVPDPHAPRQRDPLPGRRARPRGRRTSRTIASSTWPTRRATPSARRFRGRAAATNGRARGSRSPTPSRNAEDSSILPYTREPDRPAQGARRRLPHAPSARGVWAYARGDDDVRAEHDRRHCRARRSDTPALAGADPAVVLAKG